MVIKETTSTTEKKWLRDNIFRSKGTINGQECTVVIDGGSCKNIIPQALVDQLQLKVRKHHRPNFAKWVMTGDEMQVQYTCSVTFSFGRDYANTVWCTVVPINSGDIRGVKKKTEKPSNRTEPNQTAVNNHVSRFGYGYGYGFLN